MSSMNGASRKNKLPVRVADILHERLLKLQADLEHNQNGKKLPFNEMMNELIELFLVSDEMIQQMFSRHFMPGKKGARAKTSAIHY